MTPTCFSVNSLLHITSKTQGILRHQIHSGSSKVSNNFSPYLLTNKAQFSEEVNEIFLQSNSRLVGDAEEMLNS